MLQTDSQSDVGQYLLLAGWLQRASSTHREKPAVQTYSPILQRAEQLANEEASAVCGRKRGLSATWHFVHQSLSDNISVCVRLFVHRLHSVQPAIYTPPPPHHHLPSLICLRSRVCELCVCLPACSSLKTKSLFTEPIKISLPWSGGFWSHR